MEIHLEFKPAHSVARFCTGIHVQLSVLTDVTLGVLGTPGPPPPAMPYCPVWYGKKLSKSCACAAKENLQHLQLSATATLNLSLYENDGILISLPQSHEKRSIERNEVHNKI